MKVILRNQQGYVLNNNGNGQSKSINEFTDEQLVTFLRQATRAEVYFAQESTQDSAKEWLETFVAHFKGDIKPINSENMVSKFGLSRSIQPSRNDVISDDRKSKILEMLSDANVGLTS